METTTRTTKHFEFTGETKELDTGITLHRIRATIETEHAKIGDLGGWIEKPENLCDNAWVSGEACVYGNAYVYNEAKVSGNAHVSGGARVSGGAHVFGGAHIFGNARVSGNAKVYNDAYVFGDARVSGNAKVYNDAYVHGDARVSGNAKVYNDAVLYDNACVYGNSRVYGNAQVSGNADIKSNNDHCGFDGFGSDNIDTYAYRTTEGVEITSYDFTYGSFRGSLDEFAAKIKETYCDSEYEKQYELIIRLIKLKFNLQD